MEHLETHITPAGMYSIWVLASGYYEVWNHDGYQSPHLEPYAVGEAFDLGDARQMVGS